MHNTIVAILLVCVLFGFGALLNSRMEKTVEAARQKYLAETNATATAISSQPKFSAMQCLREKPKMDSEPWETNRVKPIDFRVEAVGAKHYRLRWAKHDFALVDRNGTGSGRSFSDIEYIDNTYEAAECPEEMKSVPQAE